MCGKFDRKEIILWRADKKSTRWKKEARINLSEIDLTIQHIKEKKKNLIKDLNKAMFILRLKDIDQTIVNKNIEEQEEETLQLLSQINRTGKSKE